MIHLKKLIIERLKLNKDTKIQQPIINQLGYDESLLNVNIQDFDHLKDILSKYFEPYNNNDKGYMLYIPKNCRTKKLKYSYKAYEYEKIFVIEFCKIGIGPIRKLYVAKSGSNFYMQILIKDFRMSNSFADCNIIGIVDELSIGDNLLDWLNNVKEHTINKESGREINLMETFFGNINKS